MLNKKAIAAWNELAEQQNLLRVAKLEKDVAEERLQHAGSSREWSEIADEFALANGKVIKAQHRIKILTGRIHFYSQTV